MDEKENNQINQNTDDEKSEGVEQEKAPQPEQIVFTNEDQSGVRYYSLGNQTRQYDRKRSRNKGLLIFGIILLAIIFMAVSCRSILWSGSEIEEGFSSTDGDFIGVLYLEGTIAAEDSSSLYSSSYNQTWLLNRIDDAMTNSSNKGLIVFVNTPGGAVYETDEVYLKLQKYKKTTGRPVYAAMGSMAASGGYYISAAADKIIANRNCWTGSIGVTVGTLYDISDLLDKYGVKTVTITSGRNKAMGSMTDPLTKEQQQIMQSLVDDSYDQFVGIVADGRNMDEKKVRKLADGRIYTARQAKANGLVDELGTLDDAINTMKKENGLNGCDTVKMQYETPSTLTSIFSKLNMLADKSQSDVSALLQLMQDQGQMPISYMSNMTK